MATLNKFNAFVENLAEKIHNLQSDTLKVALTNTAPTAADTGFNTTTYPAPAAASGYTAGGNTLTVNSSAQTSGTYKLVLANTTFTASGGQIGPFRYAVVYNNTPVPNSSIGWYDYGSSITLNDTETFSINFDQTNGALQIV